MQKIRERWKRIDWKKPANWFWLFILVMLLAWVGRMLYQRIIFDLPWVDWTGFSDYQPPNDLYQRGKTLWDWLELIFVPATLALVAWYLSASQQKSERANANAETKKDREIAAKNRANEQRISSERIMEDRLREYLDKMREALIDDRLKTPECADEVRDVARTRTLLLLRELDGTRKTLVLYFLFETELITGGNPVISLKNADCSQVSFKDMEAANLNFSSANFKKADLSLNTLRESYFNAAKFDETKIEESGFYDCVFHDTDFSSARLRFSRFVNADLNKARFVQAVLTGAKFWDSDAWRADFSQAKLSGAEFENSDLKGCCFNKAHFTAANLNKINFAGSRFADADLTGAQLRDVSFLNADITVEQIEKAKVIENVVLPDGTVYSND